MARRRKTSSAAKWGIIGTGSACGAALIPLIPAIKKRAMRVTTILKKDHRMVSGLIMALEMTPRINSTVRKSLFEQIRHSVMVHAQAEEEILYPSMRNFRFMSGETKVDDAYREHQQIKDLLNDLETMDPNTDAFDTKFADFKTKLDHHVEDEESDMFVLLKDLMSTEHQEELGRRIQDRKMDLKAKAA